MGSVLLFYEECGQIFHFILITQFQIFYTWPDGKKSTDRDGLGQIANQIRIGVNIKLETAMRGSNHAVRCLRIQFITSPILQTCYSEEICP